MQKSEDEWKQELTREEYYVIRQKGTERPGTGEYNKFYPKEGHFICRACKYGSASEMRMFAKRGFGGSLGGVCVWGGGGGGGPVF